MLVVLTEWEGEQFGWTGETEGTMVEMRSKRLLGRGQIMQGLKAMVRILDFTVMERHQRALSKVMTWSD